MAKDSPSLAELMQKASPKDVEDIDAQIADIQTQQDELQRAIDSLRIIRKAIDIRLNGKQKRTVQRKSKAAEPASAPGSSAPGTGAASTAVNGRPPRSSAAADGEGPARATMRNRIFSHLRRKGEPQKPSDIGSALNIDGRTVLALVRHPWFKMTAAGVSVA